MGSPEALSEDGIVLIRDVEVRPQEEAVYYLLQGEESQAAVEEVERDLAFQRPFERDLPSLKLKDCLVLGNPVLWPLSEDL